MRSAQSAQNAPTNEESAPTTAGQPLYTASGVFVVELSKEDMKLVFSGDSTLPFNGYSNSVMCIYPDQICFYYYNEASSSYQFIVSNRRSRNFQKNMARVSCVNTRLDRVMATTNTLQYGILIMDKAQQYMRGEDLNLEK